MTKVFNITFFVFFICLSNNCYAGGGKYADTIFILFICLFVFLWWIYSSINSSIQERKNLKIELDSSVHKCEKLKLELQSTLNNLELKTHELESIVKDRNKLYDFNLDVLSRIKIENSLLPSVVMWCDKIQKMIDDRDARYLIEKKHPAYKAHEEIIKEKSDRRKWQSKARALQNIITLYETQAPWLAETLSYSVDDIVYGLNIIKNEDENRKSGHDPARAYITPSEWVKLSKFERCDIAINRYFECRAKSAWLAGIMYERFIGHLYEKEGFDVVFNGAIHGLEDLGRDLICRKNGIFVVVQCKRILENKFVHENVVAQTYGTALVFKHIEKLGAVTPTIITTSCLSEQAKHFAEILNVKFRENLKFERYPCIKCNISTDGDKIYHLPFDQQYDTTKIKNPGEFYAMTCSEAESHGFRRAFRWRGNS